MIFHKDQLSRFDFQNTQSLSFPRTKDLYTVNLLTLMSALQVGEGLEREVREGIQGLHISVYETSL